MAVKQYIKRHISLQPISREHHFGLLLCWKIRQGFRFGAEPNRIKRYSDWFWKNHLLHHFIVEEKYIFSVLPDDDELVIQALSEHQRLKALFEKSENISESLQLIEKELDKHIRFEERVLFNKVQQVATPTQLRLIEEKHNEPFHDNWDDEFWKEEKSG